MQPNDQQNYWQPQDEAEAPKPTQPVNPARPETAPEKTAPAPQAEEPLPRSPLPEREPDEISWQASETIEHARGPLWYVAFGIIVLALFVVTIWLREWIFSALVVVVAITVVIMSRRPPRIFDYTLNDQGLIINDQMRYYSDFRAFGIVQDEAFFAIKLIPSKRFSPEVMVYFSEKDGETIVDILGSHLPMEDMKLDLADKIIRKIRL